MISSRFKYEVSLTADYDLPIGATDWIARWHRTLENVDDGAYVNEASPCGAKPTSEDAELLAERDRYGFPVKTWISKRSGLVWTSPRMGDGLANEFYKGYFQAIYRGPTDVISTRFARQVARGASLLAELDSSRAIDSLENIQVLDVGCGAGGFLVPFLERGAKVSGCDIGGSNYIDFGNKLNLNLRECPSQQLEVEGNKYSIVILSHVLEHIPHPLHFLDHLGRLLVDGGLLLVEVPGIMFLGPYKQDFLRYLQNSHTHHYSKSTLCQLLAHAGYETLVANDEVRLIARKSDSARGSWDPNEYREIRAYLDQLECARNLRIRSGPIRRALRRPKSWVKQVLRFK